MNVSNRLRDLFISILMTLVSRLVYIVRPLFTVANQALLSV